MPPSRRLRGSRISGRWEILPFRHVEASGSRRRESDMGERRNLYIGAAVVIILLLVLLFFV